MHARKPYFKKKRETFTGGSLERIRLTKSWGLNPVFQLCETPSMVVSRCKYRYKNSNLEAFKCKILRLTYFSQNMYMKYDIFGIFVNLFDTKRGVR